MANGSQSIVVACDGSGHALHAAKLAAEIAKATGHSLKLLAVFPGSRAEKLVVAGAPQSKIDEEMEHYGREAFDPAQKAVEGIAGSAEEVLLKGDPAKEIIEYMEENPGVHLFLGRRGHSLVRSLTLGSISEKVVRHATAPVTVVSE